jgi:phosphohistidine swiveling domain-containing protein
MPLIHTLNAGMRTLRQYLGSALWTSVVVFEENQGKWLFRPKELTLLGQKMIDFLMCPPYQVAFLTGYQNSRGRLLKKAEGIQSFDLASTTVAGLHALFDEFSSLYYAWYRYGWFCEPVQFQSQDLLQRCLERDVKAKLPDFDVKKAVLAVFTIDRESFSISILRHLAECANALGRVLRDSGVRGEVERLTGCADFPAKAASVILAMPPERSSDLMVLRDLLRQHACLFYWKRNNYCETVVLTEIDVLVEILSADDFDPGAPARAIESELAKVDENRRRLLAEKREVLGLLTPYYKKVAALASLVGGSLLDDRKRTIMIANDAFDRLLGSAACRTGMALSDCRFLIPQEFSSFLERPADYTDRIERRKRMFVVFQGDFAIIDDLVGDVARKSEVTELQYADFGMDDPFIAEGAEAEKLLNDLNLRLHFFDAGRTAAIDSLQGVTAYCDSADQVIEGPVRVILNPKTEEAQRGEILVASSTTPDYMGSILKCRAIVTDWGGQTSHAATVARELHKPCIIATNYASQVLRTGDLVRLHFGTGVVETIRR